MQVQQFSFVVPSLQHIHINDRCVIEDKACTCMQETGTTTTEQTNPPPPPTAPTAMLWLRNLPANAVQHRDVLERAFKQWGVKNVRLVHDPATEEGPPMGHALVQLREHAQVGWLQ